MTKRRNFLESFNSIANDRLIDGECPLDYLGVDEPFITANGVMMGDPGTKGLLTLLNLAAFIEAQDELENVQVTIEDIIQDSSSYHREWSMTYHAEDHTDEASQLEWRGFYETRLIRPKIFFSCAGDDHVAMCLRAPLEAITSNHVRNQMVPSKEKNFLSRRGVVYCERLLLRTHGTHMLDPRFNEASDTTMVDSIKIRLMSPSTKNQESQNETNPSIGKAFLLRKFQSWMPVGWRRFSSRVLPHRFYNRMYRFLPHRANGAVHGLVSLPIPLGGFGLALEGGLSFNEGDLLDSHALLLESFIEGNRDPRLFKATMSLLKNRYARGVSFEESIIDEQLEELELAAGAKALSATLNEFTSNGGEFVKGDAFDSLKRKLAQKGYIAESAVKNLLIRVQTQQRLFTEEVHSGWKTARWDTRIARFDETCKSLIRLYEDEGRIAAGRKANIQSINEYFLTAQFEQIEKILWKEELFFWKDFEVELNESTSTRPLQDLLDHAVSLELPPITNRGWFGAETGAEDR